MGSIPTSMLISAVYDGPRRRAALKFYNGKTHKLETYLDESGHLPYCYSRLSRKEINDAHDLESRDDVESIVPTKIRDNLSDGEVEMSKIVVRDPLAIGGTQSGHSIRDMMQTWESDIKYYENYLYDNGLVMGRYYSISGSEISPQSLPIPDMVSAALKSMLLDKETGKGMPDPEQYQEYVTEWAETLNQPIPRIRRLSFDIEVDSEKNRIPDPHLAERRVTAVGFEGSDGVHEVYVLGERGKAEAETAATVTYYADEKQMILDAFAKIADYPVVLTFNGDDFDMPYLHNRARHLGIQADDNPLYMMRDAATLKRGVHVDLYRTFSNRAFQVYAFSNKYSEYSLNSVSAALLGEKKLDYGVPLDDLTPEQLASYCYNDARLTYMLTSFGDDLLIKLLVVISRIARMPIDDIARLGVSQWIRSLLYYEHRRHKMLIPRRDDLSSRFDGTASTDAVMKDKKYRGGLVVDPQKGIHFRVTVMDFASLYPSIIKVQNLSYETVRCAHEECRSNAVPDTPHWVCKRRNGITALLIGSLRDLRVNYYKSLSRDASLGEVERQQYSVVSQALKIILNASYGVMGAELFPLYFLPAAEATTAIGRHIIVETIKKCEASGIKILYGDTDSIFIKDPTPEQVQRVIEGAKADHGVELEVDKEYRYVVLSDRKKNYFGVTTSGKVDVKGLTGKKSHTPPFIRGLFGEITGILSDVSSEADFERIKVRITAKMRECADRLKSRGIPLEDLAFNVMLSKSPSEYTKNVPQHIKAAMQLERASSKAGDMSSFMQGSDARDGTRKIKRGDIISYVKTVTRPGVKPVELARPDEIDTTKYMEFMESTLDQVTSVLGMDFAEIMGEKKQSGLGEFFHRPA